MKPCAQCGALFGRRPRRSAAQWKNARFCSGPCANQWRAQRQVRLPSTTRRLGERWARWWEQQRRIEDSAELKAWKPKVWPQSLTKHKPTARLFVMGYCVACADTWVDYPKRKPSGYCNRCQDRRWAADSRHKRRVWKARAQATEVISPEVVFKRDGYRCRICGGKTRGKHPNPKAPTIDHIVPLSKGGDHSYLNVQCAHWDCNTRKGDRAADDQLRLVA
jgi:5-methylcytosine-specific restriction endonuclease McrA